MSPEGFGPARVACQVQGQLLRRELGRRPGQRAAEADAFAVDTDHAQAQPALAPGRLPIGGFGDREVQRDRQGDQ